jgi:circadian clock protein KaiB
VGRYQLSVVDIHDASVEARVLAVPTLVRDSPLPVRRVVGDLADIEKVLQALEISGAKITSSGSD